MLMAAWSTLLLAQTEARQAVTEFQGYKLSISSKKPAYACGEAITVHIVLTVSPGATGFVYTMTPLDDYIIHVALPKPAWLPVEYMAPFTPEEVQRRAQPRGGSVSAGFVPPLYGPLANTVERKTEILLNSAYTMTIPGEYRVTLGATHVQERTGVRTVLRSNDLRISVESCK
jgi:hypothetical protein